jgi:hypothetical protein
MALHTPLEPTPLPWRAPLLTPEHPHASAAVAGARWHALALRVGFLGAGASLLSVAMAAWSQGDVTTHHDVVGMVFAAYAVAFVLLAAGALPPAASQRLSPLILAGAVGGLLLFSYVQLRISLPTYQTDNAVFSHVAAEQLLNGRNPYAIQDRDLIANSAQRFGLQATFLTHTTDGTALDNLMSWPSGSILPLAPFLKFGGSDVRWVVVAFEIAVMVLLWLAAPRELRPLSVLPMLVDRDLFLQFTGGGVMDFMWVAPMVGAAIALYRRHFIWSALCFGLAAGTKQQPWLLAPFLMLYVWNVHQHQSIRGRLRECSIYGCVAAASFLVLNGPFIVLDPAAWVHGTMLPVTQQLVPFGSGLSMLTQTGIADLPKSFYSLATFGAWGVLLLAYALYFRTLKHALWLMPAIIMWFGYRGLQNYFIYWTPLLMVAVFAWWNEETEAQAAEETA